MTNVNRFIRKISDDPRCLTCGEVENTEHIIRKCPAARVVWRRLGWRDNAIESEVMFPQLVLENLGEDIIRTNEDSVRVFAVTMWWLWRWRNEKAFSREVNIHVDQMAYILARVGEISRAMEVGMLNEGTKKRRRVERLIRWVHPREG